MNIFSVFFMNTYECIPISGILIDEITSRFEGIMTDTNKLEQVRKYYEGLSYEALIKAFKDNHGPESNRRHGCSKRRFQPRSFTG